MTPPVGADIEAQCNKCGGPRWHVIEAKVGEEIVRVQCKECHAQHRYKNPNKAAPAPRRAAATGEAKPRAPRAEKVVERFATPAVAADLSLPVRTYKANEHFTPGERVEHPTFGQGVVEVSEPGKVTLFFASGRKVLVQARGEPGKGLARPAPFDHSRGIGIAPPKHAPNAPDAGADDSDDADDADDGN
ncbi:MAG TPA: hypothetical protein VHE35_35795 [Kofleriaceae bacterium]|nr:hypothetical protein [Kofleriaceae bacterium]